MLCSLKPGVALSPNWDEGVVCFVEPRLETLVLSAFAGKVLRLMPESESLSVEQLEQQLTASFDETFDNSEFLRTHLTETLVEFERIGLIQIRSA